MLEVILRHGDDPGIMLTDDYADSIKVIIETGDDRLWHLGAIYPVEGTCSVCGNDHWQVFDHESVEVLPRRKYHDDRLEGLAVSRENAYVVAETLVARLQITNRDFVRAMEGFRFKRPAAWGG